MPPVSPVVYDNTSLIIWKEELQRILELSELIRDKGFYLKKYQDELSSVNSEILPIHSQLAASQNQFQRNHHHSHGAEKLRLIAATTDSLQSELARLQKESGRLLNQIQSFEGSIREAQTALSASPLPQSWYEEHVPACERFLQTMQTDPARLVGDLYDKLVKEFAAYEEKHLMKLSPQVRISLMVVRYQLHTLFENYASYAPEYSNQIHQRNYLCLCGFIWDLYQRVELENKDSEFERLLGTLVQSTHVVQDGDLPDHLRTGFSARAWFDAKKQAYSWCFALQEDDLPRIEEDVFNSQLRVNKQSGYYLYPTVLQDHILKAIRLIETEIELKKQKQEEIDYYFYGRVVRVLNEVFANPADKLAANRIAEIAEYASVASSFGKKVLGGLVIVLGVLLVGVSLAGFAATFGFSSMLSAWGVALGLSLIQTQVALVATSSVVATTGIGLSFFTGPSIIKSRDRSELHKELMFVKSEVEDYAAPPPITAPTLDEYPSLWPQPSF